MRFLAGLVILVMVCGASPSPGAIPSADEVKSRSIWLKNHFGSGTATPPCSFTYASREAGQLLAKWKRASSTHAFTDRTLHTTSFTDPQTGLIVRCEVAEFRDHAAVEWVVYLKNTGSTDTPILSDIRALDTVMPSPSGDAVLHYARGAVCSMDDFAPLTEALRPGTRLHLEPAGGRSSSDFLPFFNLETPSRGGVVIGLGWSGEWAADFTQEDARRTRLQAGMALTHLKLHPGEEIRTPRVALLFYQGDWIRGQNLWRRFVLDRHRPEVNGKPFDPPIFNTNWGGTPATNHLENIDALVAHDLPVEFYWIDAEWFGRGAWWLNPGDWRVKQDLYPAGFRPISDALHQSGRKLLLWFEPERVCEGTPWFEEHPRWLLEVPPERRVYNWGDKRTFPDWVTSESRRNQIVDSDRLFNLALPEARQFLTDFISARIAESGLDCYRHDANIAPLEFWRAADTPDRQGITEIRWVEGLYAFWDELLHRHPGLLIDNCASGGRRIDLETLSRSTPFWRSDAGPRQRLCLAQHDFQHGHLRPVRQRRRRAGPAAAGRLPLRESQSHARAISPPPTLFPWRLLPADALHESCRRLARVAIPSRRSPRRVGAGLSSAGESPGVGAPQTARPRPAFPLRGNRRG
jgi:alpha-galactosidase